MKDVSVLIPARNEQFLAQTIDNILANAESDIEIIAVLDGCWPNPPLVDNKRVILIHHTEPVGQRAAVNEAACLSRAKYVMKLDGHSAVDKGFDVKLMKDCEKDWTVIPRLYKLHAFDWVCTCGLRQYQIPPLTECPKCKSPVTQEIVWKPKLDLPLDFARFDTTMHFQYWNKYNKRPEAQADIADNMSSLGACFFMHRERFFELEGLDEAHGFWGQFGTEIACKSWLSGGRHVVNKKTWYSHFFRVGGLKFPYSLSGDAQERARQYSRDLWLNNKWAKAKRPLSWIIEHFAPVPDWS